MQTQSRKPIISEYLNEFISRKIYFRPETSIFHQNISRTQYFSARPINKANTFHPTFYSHTQTKLRAFTESQIEKNPFFPGPPIRPSSIFHSETLIQVRARSPFIIYIIIAVDSRGLLYGPRQRGAIFRIFFWLSCTNCTNNAKEKRSRAIFTLQMTHRARVSNISTGYTRGVFSGFQWVGAYVSRVCFWII